MTEHIETLERLVDYTTAADVLEMLAAILHEKAEHVRHYWQDRTLAARWDRAAMIVDAAATKLYDLHTPGIGS